MNYRHIYHAGGFADIFKHIVLLLAVDYLQQKDKPCFFLDTHAGTGLYDLQSEEALKTGESATGITRLRERTDLPGDVKRFEKMAAAIVRGKGKSPARFYPGSPLFLQKMLRVHDRFVANELHPEDVQALRKNLGRDRRIKVEQVDGYGLLKALLPPPERRGAVLIDPPFEVRDEFTRMERAMKQALKRWATGIYILWYPVKDIKTVQAFQDSFTDKTGSAIAVDFFIQEPADPAALNGCGVVVINPPWTLAGQLQDLLPWLAQTLTDGKGYFEIRILAEKT